MGNLIDEVPDVTATLTPLDRCDRCGAQAYVVTAHRAGQLMFCAHHFRAHQSVLDARKVLDVRARIAE